MQDNGNPTQRHYRTITVNIISAPGAAPNVDVEPSTVSKGYKDIIRWRCDNDPNWRVDFGADSPFHRSTFDKAHDTSGPGRHDAEEKYYKYSVTAGGGTTDPGTIVDP
jgi:hypothetical protein